jgi:hypothetical protein
VQRPPHSATGCSPAGGSLPILPLALLRLAGLFLVQSAVGGIDVARRALDPRLPISPGLVDVDLEHDDLSIRVALAALISLLPGTIAVEAERRSGPTASTPPPTWRPRSGEPSGPSPPPWPTPPSRQPLTPARLGPTMPGSGPPVEGRGR